jgi:hypothetical protein
VEGRTYTGWKAGLVVIGTVTVVFVLLNVLARNNSPRRNRPIPTPTIVHVTPS